MIKTGGQSVGQEKVGEGGVVKYNGREGTGWETLGSYNVRAPLKPDLDHAFLCDVIKQLGSNYLADQKHVSCPKVQNEIMSKAYEHIGDDQLHFSMCPIPKTSA